MSIKKDFLVEKRNVLNEIRSNSMTLQELRFFSIYLAKINSRDISTRVVRFKLSDFQRIMELGKLNLAQLRDTVDGLLCKVVEIPIEKGGFERFQLFKKTVFAKNESEEWYIEIDAHDDALPLMFEFKERYFTYELWVALRLKSSNQFRMYEILKQYESVGERVVAVDDLRGFLGIEASEYPRFNSFRERVIDTCQEALETYTDIRFTYEPAKREARGKISAIKFNISHNENYVDQLALDDFIDRQNLADDDIAASTSRESDNLPKANYFEQEVYPLLADACDGEFNLEEMQVLYNMIVKIIPYDAKKGKEEYKMDIFDYLKRKYDELKRRAKRNDLSEVQRRFGYMKKTIEIDFED